MSKPEKLDSKILSQTILQRAGLAAPWTSRDNVDDFTKAASVTTTMFFVDKPAQVLQCIMGAMDTQACLALGNALVDQETLEPKLKNDETYLRELLVLIKQTFLPQIHPLEPLPKLYNYKYKPVDGISINNHLDQFAVLFANALRGLIGTVAAEGILKGIDKNENYIRAAIEGLPEYLRLAVLAREKQPETFSALRKTLFKLDADMTHRKPAIVAPSSSAPTLSASASASKAPAKEKQKESKTTGKALPSTPCKICNKNLFHWHEDCPENTTKKPSAYNLRSTTPQDSQSSPTLPPPAVLLGRGDTFDSKNSPAIAMTGVPIALGSGGKTFNFWGVFDDGNMVATLVTTDAATQLGVPLSASGRYVDLGGGRVNVLGDCKLRARIARDEVDLTCLIVAKEAIPISGCDILLTLNDSDAFRLHREPKRVFKVDGVALPTSSDFAAAVPKLPAISMGSILATVRTAPHAADRSAIEFLTAPDPAITPQTPSSPESSTDDIGEDPMPGLTLRFEPGATIKRKIELNGTEVAYSAGAGLSEEQYSRIDSLLKEHERVFYYKGRKFSHKLPAKHQINTTAYPRKVYPREYKGVKLDATRAIVKDWTERGIIRPSSHPEAQFYENPLHVVTKDESKPNLIEAYRATADGRATNEVTRRNRPRPTKTVRSVANGIAKLDWISKLDGKDFYLQIEIEEAHKHKSSFSFEGIKYEFVGAIFGLAYPGDTVEDVLEVFKSENPGYVENFVDDFFIGAADTTADEHIDQLAAWLRTLLKYDAVVNTKDICIACPKVLGLGYRLGDNEISIPYDRRAALKKLTRPTTREQLNSALLTYNFYRDLIPNYGDFNVRFRDLLKPSTPWLWTAAHEAAWDDFKKMLDDEVHGIAMPFDDAKPVVIRPDASDYGLGATLLQYDPKWRKLRPVLYYSARIDDADVKIAGTTIKEAFSGHGALMHWAPILVGRRVLMQYDHLPIIGFVPKNTSSAAKHWRWFKDYMGFDLEFEHVPGTENSIADLFSRLVDLPEEPDLPGTTSSMLAEHVSRDSALSDIRAHIEDADHVITVPDALNIIKALGGTDRIELINHLLFAYLPGRYRTVSRRLLLPASLVKDYLNVAHAEPTSGHLRGEKFRNRLAHVWWLTKERDIASVEADCAICLRVKSAGKTYTGPHQAARIDTPFNRWTIDFFEIFEQKIITGVEAFTGYPEARIVDGEKSTNAIDFVLNDIIARHGRFGKCRSDNGPAFTSAEFKAFCKKYLIDQELSDAERPEGHGQIERMNRTLEEIIRCILPDLNNNLGHALSVALFAIRSATHAGSKYSPFELSTGRKPLLLHPLELDPFSDTTDVKDFATQIMKNIDIAVTGAIANRETYTANMQRLLDSRAVPHPFRVGDLVGVARDFDKNHDIARFDGPFKIIGTPTANTLTVDLPSGPKRVNVSTVKPFNGTAPVPPLPGPTPSELGDSSWMEAPPNLLSEQLLFKRVKVKWPGNTWYTGTVTSILRNKHFVLYDDKDSFNDPLVPEGLTLPKRRPKYRVLVSDFGPSPAGARS